MSDTDTVAPDNSQSWTSSSDKISLWRKLCTTPIRDAMRLRLTARFDIKSRIATSGLPASIQKCIGDVVRHSRLWRIERVDVASELIQHFRDGVDSGADSGQLIRAFGDTRTAAKLIRRAKKRQRALGWKVIVRSAQSIGALIAIFVLWYVAALAYYFSGSPVISHDFVADVTASARSVPAEQRAWPVYREAMIPIRRDLEAMIESPDVQPLSIATHPGGDDVDWKRTVEFVNAHREEIAQLRRAGRMSGFGYVPAKSIHEADRALWPDQADTVSFESDQFNDSLYGIRMPYLLLLRTASKLLSADAYLAAQTNDGGRALADLQAMLGAAEHSRETPTVISDLVGLAIGAMTADTVGRIIADHPDSFNDDQLRDLAHALGNALTDSMGGELNVRLDSERLAFHDLVQHIYTDDGTGDGHITARGLETLANLASGEPRLDIVSPLAFPIAATVMADREDMLAEYDRIMAIMQAEAALPLWQKTNASMDALVEGKSSLHYNAKYWLITLMMPALSRIDVNAEKATMRRDAILTVIALELHRREHAGLYPDSLEALVPTCLPAVPIDRFVGTPLGYVVRDGRPVVYCVGADHDDDAGVAPKSESASRGESTVEVDQWYPASTIGQAKGQTRGAFGQRLPDGDWILWPPTDEDPSQRTPN